MSGCPFGCPLTPTLRKRPRQQAPFPPPPYHVRHPHESSANLPGGPSSKRLTFSNPDYLESPRPPPKNGVMTLNKTGSWTYFQSVMETPGKYIHQLRDTKSLVCRVAVAWEVPR